MKTPHKTILLLLFLVSFAGFSQTAEQQKMIDKALKMRDSIMNIPEMKMMMEQMSEMDKKEKTKKKTSPAVNPIPEAIKSEDKYWKNTLASDNNTILKNWNSGEADLVFNYFYDSRNDEVKYIKVGVIKADGTIELNPKSEVPMLQALNNFKNSNNFLDIYDSNTYQYTNEKTGFKLNSYLLVYKNDKNIGTLTIGNSVKVTRNMLIPGDLYYGDEGYILSWVYAEEACAIKAYENRKGDLSNTGNPLFVETTVTYNLNFKPGWNLVKTEVIGEHIFPDAIEEDRSRYKKHEHTIVNAIPEDATYFFRAAVQY
jgi:hypothetical protein